MVVKIPLLNHCQSKMIGKNSKAVQKESRYVLFNTQSMRGGREHMNAERSRPGQGSQEKLSLRKPNTLPPF